MALNPIPVSEILAYCELTLIEAIDERTHLMTMVRVMDGFYLKEMAGRQDKRMREQERKRKQESKRGRRRR